MNKPHPCEPSNHALSITPISTAYHQSPPCDPSAPIGLFDSGVGGLSVYEHLSKALPHERFIYYADTLHVPYGSRDSEDILALSLRAVAWLVAQGCKLVVIACNSASAHALTAARVRYPHVAIVGLVPALKPAVALSRKRHVAVLATNATLQGALLRDVICQEATPKQVAVTRHFDPDLVPWVEAGMPTDAPAANQLRDQVIQFAQMGVDALVLGCTHYPFFKDFLCDFIDACGLDISVVDSGSAIAARVQSLLSEKRLLMTTCATPTDHHRAPLHIYATKSDPALRALIIRLVGHSTSLEWIKPETGAAHVSCTHDDGADQSGDFCDLVATVTTTTGQRRACAPSHLALYG